MALEALGLTVEGGEEFGGGKAAEGITSRGRFRGKDGDLSGMPIWRLDPGDCGGGFDDVEGLVFTILHGVVVVLAGGFELATFQPGADVAVIPELPRERAAGAGVGEAEDGEVVGVSSGPDADTFDPVVLEISGDVVENVAEWLSVIEFGLEAVVFPPFQSRAGDIESEADRIHGARLVVEAEEFFVAIVAVEEEEGDLRWGGIGGVG